MYENWITIRDNEAGIIYFSTDIWLIAVAHISCRDISHNETEWVVSDKWWKDYFLNSRIGRLFLCCDSERCMHMLLALWTTLITHWSSQGHHVGKGGNMSQNRTNDGWPPATWQAFNRGSTRWGSALSQLKGVHRQIGTLQHQPEPPDISMDTKEELSFRIWFTPQRVFKHRSARTNPQGLHTRKASQGCLSAFLQDLDAETESTCEHRPVALCQPLKHLAFNYKSLGDRVTPRL